MARPIRIVTTAAQGHAPVASVRPRISEEERKRRVREAIKATVRDHADLLARLAK